MAASGWLEVFCAAQDAFDQEERAWFDENETRKERNLAPKVGGAYLILDEIKRHFQNNPKSTVETNSNPESTVGITRVVIHEFRSAWAYASSVNSMPEIAQQLVLWTDASQSGRRGTHSYYAVALKRKGEWCTITAETHAQQQLIDTAELHAIGYALEYAVQQVQVTQEVQADERLRLVKIFTDSQGALRCISRGPAFERDSWAELKQSIVRTAVLKRIRTLEAAGVDLELHWVPRGRVEGNMVADAATKRWKIGQKTESLMHRSRSMLAELEARGSPLSRMMASDHKIGPGTRV